MPIRADISQGYRRRMALVAAACIGMALWATYDGKIGYPNQIIRANKYQEFKKAKDLEVGWKNYAKEQGWSTENPGKAHHDTDWITQYVMAGLAAPVGLLFLFRYVRSGGRWIEADETGLRTSWGQELEYGEITEIDKKKWRKKGIAKIKYQRQGSIGVLAMDDFHYDPDPTEWILREVESQAGEEKIVGGYPEPPIEEEDEEVTNDADSTNDSPQDE